jgi:hypothetical protein
MGSGCNLDGAEKKYMKQFGAENSHVEDRVQDGKRAVTFTGLNHVLRAVQLAVHHSSMPVCC